jgi:hypothetical protein
MEYAAILTMASQATAETIPQTLQALFPAMHAAALLDSEVEVILQAVRTATRVSIRTLRADWKKFLATRPQQPAPTAAAFPPEAEAEATRLLQDPALLYRAITTIGQLGVEGEAVNRGVSYLALTSRQTDDPISVLIKGRSSSGKSHLVKCALAMIPPEEYHLLTAMSAKALAYAEDLDFRHKIIVIFEDEGLGEEAEYLMRTLLTEGRLEYLTVDKGPHGLKTRRISQPGPTGLMTTMTKAMTREDNETRAWSLYVDDSKAQTLRVVKRQADAATGDATAPDTTPWQALQRRLRPRTVVIPWASTLARLLQLDTLPQDITRLRRDFPRLLTLVKVITLLYQQQRTCDADGRLIATVDDYAMAYYLVAEPFARSVHGLSARALAVADAGRELYDAKSDAKTAHDEAYVTIRELTTKLRWASRTVHKWVEQAEVADLLDIRREDKGKALKLWPTEKQANYVFSLLPTPEVLAQALQTALTAIHPVTGDALSAVPACTPPRVHTPTSITRTENEHGEVCTDRAQCASCAQNDSVTLYNDNSYGHRIPMHTPDEAAGGPVPGESVHAVSAEHKRRNGPGVHTLHTHAHSPDAASAEKTMAQGVDLPDRACVHGGGTPPPARDCQQFCPRCGEVSTHVLASNGSTACVWCSLLPAEQVFHLYDPTHIEVF